MMYLRLGSWKILNSKPPVRFYGHQPSFRWVGVWIYTVVWLKNISVTSDFKFKVYPDLQYRELADRKSHKFSLEKYSFTQDLREFHYILNHYKSNRNMKVSQHMQGFIETTNHLQIHKDLIYQTYRYSM